ncbi:MAG: tetratricopeptide repeat protein [Gammaproteobacteria bacterium]|jgi:tetratricopeptide (TPR) repeat protein|nr:tetratricopeptide repeat protein [Gammaproteobacteria bacterium]
MNSSNLESSKRSFRNLVCIIFTVHVTFISLPINAQNDEIINLFFTPVPLSQANLISLNAGGLSELDRQSATDAIPRIQAEVSALEQESLEEPELITLLSTLGVAQQALELHEEAITSFNKATDIAIEIYGENSLQQAPMLEQSIISHLKLNNISEITDIEEFLYTLKAEHYSADSAEMYSAMTNLADWYSSSYFKQGYLSLNPGFIPRVTSSQRVSRQIGGLEGGGESLNAIGNGNIRNVSINDVIDLRLRKLENLYEDYQASYTSNTTLSMVVDVARRIARLSYHAEQEMDYEREINVFDANYTDSREEAVRNSDQRRDESYDVGKVALEYVVNLVQSAEGVGVQQAAIALLDMADWELAYGRVAPAQEGYQAAYQVLRDEGYDDASIDTVLTAAVPVAIPRVGNFPATQQTSGSLGLIPNPNYTGYIDVSFFINEQGNADDITILGSSGVENSRIQTILESQLDLTKFRPVLRAGNLAAQGPVEYRYYFSY